MALDPILVADTKAWLQKVENDLRAAEVDLLAEPPLLEDALFHCQQAVEKALKAFLTWHDTPFRKIHDIEEVGRQCAEIEPALQPAVSRVSSFTTYSMLYRYPSLASPPALDDTKRTLATAREVCDSINSHLPSEVRP